MKVSTERNISTWISLGLTIVAGILWFLIFFYKLPEAEKPQTMLNFLGVIIATTTAMFIYELSRDK